MKFLSTKLYVDGRKAYISRHGIPSAYVNKSQFQSLIKPVDAEFDMIADRSTALKYENKVRQLGYDVVDLEKWGIFGVRIQFRKSGCVYD